MTSPAVHIARIPEYLQPVEGELRQVEDALNDALLSSVPTATSVSKFILDAGGKRLRPALVILSRKASLGDCDDDSLIGVAASTELIHMATLMHDDIIDGAATRRGRMTANHRWGNQVSVLTGDYMLSKAFWLMARCKDLRVMNAMAEATTAMSEGELRQIECKGDPDALMATYLSIIHDKTAAFMSACCRMGAILSGAPVEVESALARYGVNLGMAFQVTDDLLDLTGDPAKTGKAVGGDIREGKLTMPLIVARERASQTDRAALDDIITRESDVSSEDLDFVRNLVDATGAIESTMKAAGDYINRAAESLSILDRSEARKALETLAAAILHRKS